MALRTVGCALSRPSKEGDKAKEVPCVVYTQSRHNVDPINCGTTLM